MKRHSGRTVEQLADELFTAVQGAQGYAFISDGEHFPKIEQFFERIRGRLAWSQESCRIIRSFLKKYGEMPK